MPDFEIYPVSLAKGVVAVAPVPGRSGYYNADFNTLITWSPSLVITMTSLEELNSVGASQLGAELLAVNIDWAHFPVVDFGIPAADDLPMWMDISENAHRTLEAGGRVLIHCYGGQGRSGMAALRLMIGAGNDPDQALKTLREVRPKAVETDAQMAWARS